MVAWQWQMSWAFHTPLDVMWMDPIPAWHKRWQRNQLDWLKIYLFMFRWLILHVQPYQIRCLVPQSIEFSGMLSKVSLEPCMFLIIKYNLIDAVSRLCNWNSDWSKLFCTCPSIDKVLYSTALLVTWVFLIAYATTTGPLKKEPNLQNRSKQVYYDPIKELIKRLTCYCSKRNREAYIAVVENGSGSPPLWALNPFFKKELESSKYCAGRLSSKLASFFLKSFSRGWENEWITLIACTAF